MTRCAFCGGGKARRRCPGLEGWICSLCCGRHQHNDIQCTVECRYLRQRTGQDALQAVNEKFLAFITADRQWMEAAIDAYFGQDIRRLPEYEEQILLGYFCYGYENEEGEVGVDRFARALGRSLTSPEIAVLDTLRKTTWYSLFEVQKIDIDQGMQFLDLLTGEQFYVNEKSGTHQLNKFGLLLCWVLFLEDHWEMAGPVCSVPRQHLDEVRQTMRRELNKARKAHPDREDKVLLRKTIPTAQRVLRQAVLAWKPPHIVTTDGEEIVFCEAVFDIDDPEEVRKRLLENQDIEDDKDSLVWVDHRGRPQLGGGPLVLGTLRIRGQRLILKTRSKERIERGKEMVMNCLGDLVRHRLDSMTDMEAAMMEKQQAEAPSQDHQEDLPEDQVAFMGDFLQKRLMAWIDESIPALNGKTPRQANRTKKGKETIIQLLKDQEHIFQTMRGGSAVDFSLIYEELGLERP